MKRFLPVMLIALSACRDAPDRFAGPDPFDSIPDAERGRLTWSVYEDRSPAWNATSDSIYYSARSYPGFPVSGGLLLKVPRTAGRAALILESLQRAVEPQPWLGAPAVSPDGSRIAFVELTEINDPTILCTAGIGCATAPPPAPPPDTIASNTMLICARLRVRGVDGSGPEHNITIDFEGYESEELRIAHPFQRQYERDGAEIFRPSWSPDGTRLVYSDGLRLLIWNVGDAQATEIPNTSDGVWPAWSPDGQRIAFTRLQRGAVTNVACSCFQLGKPLPVQNFTRVVYNDGGTRIGTLVTIRPDGTDMQELGEGEAPAWTPDGTRLVFQRGNMLWRANADGTNAEIIPDTDFGYEPAISRDGRRLAFTRDMFQRERAPGVYSKPFDLWVVDF